MASIMKRGDSYSVRYKYKDHSGKPCEGWESFKTRKEAQERKITVEKELLDGTFLVPDTITVEEMLYKWIPIQSTKHKWSPKTYTQSVAMVQNLIVPYIGNRKVQELRTYDIEKFYATLAKTPCGQYVHGVKQKLSDKQKKRLLSSTSIHEVHTLLKTAFSYAVEWDLIHKIPLPREAPKANSEERTIWDAKTMLAALQTIENPALHLAVHMSMILSLREGEILGLQPSDLDFDAADGRGTISVNKTMQRANKDALEKLDPKQVYYTFPDRREGSKSSLILKKPKTKKSNSFYAEESRLCKRCAESVQPLSYIKKNVKSYDLTFNIWCTSRTHIRTFLRFHGFPESDRFCTFLIVKGNKYLIIVEIDGIDEGIHQCLPLLRLGHIQLAEAKQPSQSNFFNRLQHRWIAYRKIYRLEQYSKPALAIEPDELLFHLWLSQPFLCNAGLQFLSLIFQSFQPFLGRAGQNAHLDSVQHIGDADFRFLQLLFVDGQVRAFLILQFHDFGNDGIHGSVIFHQLHGFVDHQIFQPLFPHGLFIAGLFLLGSSTLVVGIHFPGVADTAFSEHQCTALTAVQLGGKQIAFLCLMTGRGLFIFRQLFLHLVEQVRVCAAERSNESPSGAFKRQNGLAQQDGGVSPRQVRLTPMPGSHWAVPHPANAIRRCTGDYSASAESCYRTSPRPSNF